MGTVSSSPISSSPASSSSYRQNPYKSSSSSLPKKLKTSSSSSSGMQWKRKLSGGRRLFCPSDRKWEPSKSVELLLYPPIGLEIPTSISMLANDHHHHHRHSHPYPVHQFHVNGAGTTTTISSSHHDHADRAASLDGTSDNSLSGRSSGSGGFSLNNPIDHYNQIISTMITAHDPDCALHGNNRRSFKMKTSTFISNESQPGSSSAVILQQRTMSPSETKHPILHVNSAGDIIHANNHYAHHAVVTGAQHARTPSDPLPNMPVYAQIKRGGSGHWRNRSIDHAVPVVVNGNGNSSNHNGTTTANGNERTPPLSSSPMTRKSVTAAAKSQITSTPVTTRTSPHHHYSHNSHNNSYSSHYNGAISDSDTAKTTTTSYNSLGRKPLVPTKIKTNGSLLMMNKLGSPTGSNTLMSSSSSSSCSSSMRANAPSSSIYASLQRPRVPPPPPPPHRIRTTPLIAAKNTVPVPSPPVMASAEFRIISQSNGHSRESLDESLPSLGSDDLNDSYSHNRSSIPVPVPPPRKYYIQQKEQQSGRMRRCQALYDCDADREDELSFEEGEVIIILRDKTDDEDWMEGYVETDVQRKGLFPASFVRFLNDSS